MMTVNQGRSAASSIPAGLALGAGGSMLLTLLLSAFTAWMMDKEMIGEGSVNACAVAILVASAAVGAIMAFRKVGHHRLLVCMAAGGVYYLLLIASTALLFSGEFQAMGATALAILGGSGAIALLGLKGEGKKRNSRYPKYHNRKVVQNRQRGNL